MRVVLAMSGGVDSSVAAWLLREAGHEVIGLFMRHGETAETACRTEQPTEPPAAAALSGVGSPQAPPASAFQLPIVDHSAKRGHKQGCCSASDALDARRVADRLEIPFYALDFQADFQRIMDYFVEEYTHARTPNPCVVCNNWLKFGKLWEYAQGVGAEAIATGHYAQVLPQADGPGLCRGLDSTKDQSYVLFGINRALLPNLLFPAGDKTKAEIRAIAAKVGLRVADKKDSQEICFITDGDYAGFVRRRGGESLAGQIVTTDGQVVGQHDGIEQFTVGQRKGLGVAFGEPRFVVRIEPDTRRVVVGRREDLACTRFTARDANWLVEEPVAPFECEVKIRYLSQPARATVTLLPERRMEVHLHEVKHAVAPGQAAVCYAGERVLGGGWIE